MPKRKEPMNLATEIIIDMKTRLARCRMALYISLAGNIIQAALWFLR